jgi:hypothetical protein
MYVGTRQPKCMWSKTSKMYAGAIQPKCIWEQENKNVCGCKTTEMYVGTGTTKMSKQDKHKSAKITYA